ncbi:MAG: GyrI-like domain-containing protein [Polaribacter sp.]|nr:GyrI-like domain-containing protein [Polaribacter sp.]MDG1811545.1 GyrI-like domain-containing protein [Polaribacter sp.]MDG1994770.1 GyrI-like domain-containing protein [Polaribacter sp.]
MSNKKTTPRFENLSEKKLIGLHVTMSLVNNKTGELWKNFMQRRKEITNNVSSDLISLQIYNPIYFQDFKPTSTFKKWATTEVSDFNSLPNGMDTLVLKGGLYAVFDHKGSGADTSIFQYIYGTWIPNSEYVLDERPHFEVLGENYKNNDPNSEEEIWIPVKKK